ncbi:hypothetical protein CJO94_19080 (plasmid) [Ralstonia solanacearum]|nr:hypothetical protein CJO94_19080 [Ralstonia solanacearum]
MIDHGHRLPDILDYTLAQVRGFLDATARAEAARDARLLSMIAIGTRGDAHNLDSTLDQLSDKATSHAHFRSNRLCGRAGPTAPLGGGVPSPR